MLFRVPEILWEPSITLWPLWRIQAPSTEVPGLYSEDLQGFFEDQLAARAPLYQEVSDSVIETDGLTIAEVVDRLLPIVDQHLAAALRPM